MVPFSLEATLTKIQTARITVSGGAPNLIERCKLFVDMLQSQHRSGHIWRTFKAEGQKPMNCPKITLLEQNFLLIPFRRLLEKYDIT